MNCAVRAIGAWSRLTSGPVLGSTRHCAATQRGRFGPQQPDQFAEDAVPSGLQSRWARLLQRRLEPQHGKT
jgi:hypothetical protein